MPLKNRSALATKSLCKTVEPQLYFSAPLVPGQEVTSDPPAAAEVESDATGSIKLWFNRDFTKVSYKLCISNGLLITEGHLHNAPAGLNGPVVAFVLNLNGEDGPAENGEDFSGCVCGCLTNEDLVENPNVPNIATLYRMIRDGNIYVNIHSENWPAGVLRGQIFPGCGC